MVRESFFVVTARRMFREVTEKMENKLSKNVPKLMSVVSETVNIKKSNEALGELVAE